MNTSESVLPARWAKSAGTLHRYFIARLTTISGDTMTGDVYEPASDIGSGSTIAGVGLVRGVECRGCLVTGLDYPVQKRNGEWHITGGGVWAAIGTKSASNEVTVYGTVFTIHLPPWATDWGGMSSSSQVGLCWDEDLQKWWPVVAKCV